jgi:hypothetical protein
MHDDRFPGLWNRRLQAFSAASSLRARCSFFVIGGATTVSVAGPKDPAAAPRLPHRQTARYLNPFIDAFTSRTVKDAPQCPVDKTGTAEPGTIDHVAPLSADTCHSEVPIWVLGIEHALGAPAENVTD